MNALLMVFTFVVLAGCGRIESSSARIALVAPFEGRYREVGYNALYASRMALADMGGTVELLPVDDGGQDVTAAQRLRALARDDSVVALILLGYAAASPIAQSALADLPAVVVGCWTDARRADTVYIASSSSIFSQLTQPLTTPITQVARVDRRVTVSDIGGLESFRRLRGAAPAFMLTSGHLPSAEFARRYRDMDQFAPHPNHLAETTYDLTTWLAALVGQLGVSRRDVAAALNQDTYSSLYSGTIAFGEDGFWVNAPLNVFSLNSGSLTPVSLDDVID